MLILIITIFISLSVSFVCSLLEACLLSLSNVDIAKISEKNSKTAMIWSKFKERIDKPIAVILIINTLAHTIGASISGAKFDQLFGSKLVVVFSIIYSLVMIQWTEILPKTLGVQHNRFLALIFAVPLKFLVMLFKPVHSTIVFINKPFESRSKNERFDALKDINVLAKFATINNKISKDQEIILSQTTRLSSMSIKDIMVDKSEIKYLSSKMSLTDALIESHIHHHTRMPLVENNDIDKIIGYINFKDIVSALQISPSNPSLKAIKRPVLIININEKLPLLLRKLTRGYQHFAIVKNINGKTAGLVTLEDLIETILGGDMDDEFDLLPTYFYKIVSNRYIVGGGCILKELRKRLEVDLPDIKISVNDWIIEISGKRNFRAEDKIQYENFVFIIRKVSRSDIHELILEIQ